MLCMFTLMLYWLCHVFWGDSVEPIKLLWLISLQSFLLISLTWLHRVGFFSTMSWGPGHFSRRMPLMCFISLLLSQDWTRWQVFFFTPPTPVTAPDCSWITCRPLDTTSFLHCLPVVSDLKRWCTPTKPKNRTAHTYPMALHTPLHHAAFRLD